MQAENRRNYSPYGFKSSYLDKQFDEVDELFLFYFTGNFLEPETMEYFEKNIFTKILWFEGHIVYYISFFVTRTNRNFKIR